MQCAAVGRWARKASIRSNLPGIVPAIAEFLIASPAFHRVDEGSARPKINVRGRAGRFPAGRRAHPHECLAALRRRGGAPATWESGLCPGVKPLSAAIEIDKVGFAGPRRPQGASPARPMKSSAPHGHCAREEKRFVLRPVSKDGRNGRCCAICLRIVFLRRRAIFFRRSRLPGAMHGRNFAKNASKLRKGCGRKRRGIPLRRDARRG